MHAADLIYNFAFIPVDLFRLPEQSTLHVKYAVTFYHDLYGAIELILTKRHDPFCFIFKNFYIDLPYQT